MPHIVALIVYAYIFMFYATVFLAVSCQQRPDTMKL